MKKKKRLLRVVLDTNILISGLFAETGPIAKIMELWADRRFELAASEEILSELDRVLHKPSIKKHFNPTENEIEEFLETIRNNTIITPSFYQTDRIKKDPSDNKFLACAVEGKADFIVSGDKHLLEIKQFHGVKIIKARTFMKKIECF